MPKRFQLTLHEGTAGSALREAPIGHFAPTAAQKLVIEFNRRFRLGNGALRKYGCSVVEMLREGPLDYEYFGLRLRFFPPLRQSASYAFLARLVGAQRACIHCGASATKRSIHRYWRQRGLLYVLCRRRLAQRYHCQRRPNSRIHSLIKSNLRANDLERVLVEEVALSDREGVARIQQGDGEHDLQRR